MDECFPPVLAVIFPLEKRAHFLGGSFVPLLLELFAQPPPAVTEKSIDPTSGGWGGDMAGFRQRGGGYFCVSK